MKQELRIRVDLQRMAARTFIASKGNRLPVDTGELMAWLMEFTEEMGRLLEHYQEALADEAMHKLPPPSVRP